MISEVRRKLEKYFWGKKLPSKPLDIDKLLKSYDNFFNYYGITQVLELEKEIPLFNNKRIEQELGLIMDMLCDTEQRAMAIVHIIGLKRDFCFFPIQRDYDSGILWAYGFAEPRNIESLIISPAIVRKDGLPSDTKIMVRAIQKEFLKNIIFDPKILFKKRIRLW